MRYYLYEIIFFAIFMTSCNHNGNVYCDSVSCRRLLPSDCEDSLSLHNVRFYNNPIYDSELEGMMCSFNRAFCRFPTDGDDFWHSYYSHDMLNDFKSLNCALNVDVTPKTYTDYMAELWARYSKSTESCGFSRVSMFFDRKYISFFEFDSVIIASNSKRKETYYAVKPQYLHDKIAVGELEWDDLDNYCASKIARWNVAGFYTSDSVNIDLLDERLEQYRVWWKKYVAICDSIATSNDLEEKSSLYECVLYYNKREKVIKEFYGKKIPNEIVSDSNLKRLFTESFEFADKASFLRIPFKIRKWKNER